MDDTVLLERVLTIVGNRFLERFPDKYVVKTAGNGVRVKRLEFKA